MKKILLILFIFILYTKSFSQEIDKIAEFEKGKFSQFFKQNKISYPGDSSYNVIYYKLNLNVSNSSQHLSGEVTVSSKSLIIGLNSFFLDLSNNLTVDSVKTDNQNILFEHSDDKIIINPERSYNLNEEFSVIVFYHGTPQTSGLGSFVFDTHDGQPSIWTLSEPYGASDWWPCKDTPGDKADSADIWITCNSDLIGVSNGRLTDIINNNNGSTTYKWKSRYPIANYLISLAISNFTFYQQYFKYSPTDSMPVVHYIYPEIFNSSKEQIDKTPLMLEIFSNKFGLYPFIKEKYGHASFGRGGMEHQTISSMGVLGEGVISHELAHQWFGDKITCKDWHHIWLNEGFATFSEGVYIEAAYGKDGYDSFISSQMSRAKQGKGSIYVQDINSVSDIFNGFKSYSKGAVVLHMLRGITGDSLFFQILKNYLVDPELAYGNATTEDFQRVAEETYGNTLEYFFNEWIYGENYPKYFIDWNYSSVGNNLFEINVLISQSTNTVPKYFVMPLQFKISSDFKDTLMTFFNNEQTETFRFVMEGEPVDFIFDPGNFILKDVIINDPPGFRVPSSFSLMQNYPNPFNNSTAIIFNVSRREKVTIKIFDVLGNGIATVFNEEVVAGEYKTEFNAEGFASGIYFYKMSAGDFIETKKLILLK